MPLLDSLTDIAPTAATVPTVPTCTGEACPPSPTVTTIPNDPGNGAPTLPQTYCVGYTRWREWMMVAPGAQSTLRPEFRAYLDVLIKLASDEGTPKADLALVRDLWSDPNGQPDVGSTEIAGRIDEASNAYCALRSE